MPLNNTEIRYYDSNVLRLPADKRKEYHEQVELEPVVGLSPHELDDFAPAFEHEQMATARGLLK